MVGKFNNRESLQCHTISVTPEIKLHNVVTDNPRWSVHESLLNHADAGDGAGGVDFHHDVTVDSGRTVEIGEEPAT